MYLQYFVHEEEDPVKYNFQHVLMRDRMIDRQKKNYETNMIDRQIDFATVVFKPLQRKCPSFSRTPIQESRINNLFPKKAFFCTNI